MNKIEKQRFEILKKEFISAEEIRSIFEVNISDSYLLLRLKSFTTNLKRKKLKQNEENYSRYIVELFFQFYRILPFNFAAIRLGMSAKSLRETLEKMDEKGLLITNTLNYPEDIIDESIIKEFHKFFNGTQNTIFNSHTSFCNKLHKAINDELSIHIEPIYCSASEYLEEETKLFAHYYCFISKKPVSVKYSQYMNFGKPISLLPDICSKLFLFQNQKELSDFIMGDMPNLEVFRK